MTWITVKEAAEAAKVSEKTITRWARDWKKEDDFEELEDNQRRVKKAGKAWLINASALEASTGVKIADPGALMLTPAQTEKLKLVLSAINPALYGADIQNAISELLEACSA